MLKPPPDAQAVVAAASAAAFGRPLVQNNLRALLVEAMIDAVLPDAWTWVAANWAGWDFKRAGGIRLEVKQTAARQSWETTKPGRCSFDIRPRTGHWENGNRWIEHEGRKRNAEIYVFAHHPVDNERADHRDPAQWRFYVVPEFRLPPDQADDFAGERREAPRRPCGQH